MEKFALKYYLTSLIDNRHLTSDYPKAVKLFPRGTGNEENLQPHSGSMRCTAICIVHTVSANVTRWPSKRHADGIAKVGETGKATIDLN